MHAAQIGQSALHTVPEKWQLSHHANDATGRDCTRADIKDIRLADTIGSHLADGYRARRDNSRGTFAEKFDRGDENQIGKNAARAHDGTNPRPDDVTHA